MKKIRVHVYIAGRVQGVGYRYSTVQKAKNLGITGWVRNTHDGKVEAIFEGDENSVEEMIAWCKQGPPMSFVLNIEVYNQPYTGEFQKFSVKG